MPGWRRLDDQPWLQDLFAHRPTDRQWYGENVRYTVISGEGIGYVHTDETPGWVFEGMYGSWVWDCGLGGSFQTSSDRDPESIAVGVAATERLRTGHWLRGRMAFSV